MNRPESLSALAEELEAVADKLRAEAVDADEAADLVERCAEIAARLGAEIDSRARGASESEGQQLVRFYPSACGVNIQQILATRVSHEGQVELRRSIEVGIDATPNSRVSRTAKSASASSVIAE